VSTSRQVVRFDRQMSARRHRILGVEPDVEQRACELTGVNADWPQIGSGPNAQLDVLAQRSPEQRLGACDDGVRIHESGLDH